VDRHNLVAGIKLVAPTSPVVMNNAPMEASLNSLLIKDQALSASNTKVAGDKQQLKADTAAETTCRSDFDGELRTYVTFAENGSSTPADLHSTGLPPLAPRVTKTTLPEVPEAIDTTFPKKGHGKATVSVHETGKTRRQYVAQWSADPITATSWAQLGVGQGKTRVLTGATGTKIWVRFATVRSGMQSDWSAPILVTIP
jgi:hypothetical protein